MQQSYVQDLYLFPRLNSLVCNFNFVYKIHNHVNQMDIYIWVLLGFITLLLARHVPGRPKICLSRLAIIDIVFNLKWCLFARLDFISNETDKLIMYMNSIVKMSWQKAFVQDTKPHPVVLVSETQIVWLMALSRDAFTYNHVMDTLHWSL